jgi:hypothetical protein
MASNKSRHLKAQLIAASRANFGNVSKACEAVGVARRTYYEYLNKDEKFREQIEEIDEANIDFAESKIRELINGVQIGMENDDGEMVVYKKEPNVTATIFYLKTKGKKRGYVEKQEVENSGVQIIQVEYVNESQSNNQA